jgi:hypothetical protein
MVGKVLVLGLLASATVAFAQDKGKLTLSWKNTPGTRGINIYMKGPEEHYNLLTAVGGNKNTLVVRNLIKGNQYCFKLRAINEMGPSPYTEEVCRIVK